MDIYACQSEAAPAAQRADQGAGARRMRRAWRVGVGGGPLIRPERRPRSPVAPRAGYKPNQASEQKLVSQAQPEFVALQLPAPRPERSAATAPAEAIRVELKRGALAVIVTWPTAASSQCAAWLSELLR